MKKFALLYLPVAFVILLVVAWVGIVLTRGDMERLSVMQRAQMEFGRNVATFWVSSVLNHVAGMLREPEVSHAAQTSTPESLAWMESHLTTLLYRNPLYDRARWLDSKGMELVLVRQTEDRPAVAPKDQLADRSDRSWFRDILNQPPGKIYMSAFDYSLDGDTPEIPLKPVIRFGVRLPAEGGREPGVLMLNLRGETLLKHLQNSQRQDDGESIFLINNNGDSLFSPDPKKQTNISEISFAGNHPDEWKRIAGETKGQMMTPSGLWTWTTIDPAFLFEGTLATKETWKLATNVPANAIAEMAWNRWWPLLAVATAALVIMGFGVWNYRKLWEQRDAGRNELALAIEKQTAERKLRMTTEGAAVGVWNWDAATGEMDLSDICKKHLARADGGKDVFDNFLSALHPEDSPRVRELLREAIDKRGEYATEFRVVHPDGSLSWIASQGRVFLFPDGNLEGMGGATMDITSRKLAEREREEFNLALEQKIEERTAHLFETRERLSKTIENAPSGVCLISPEGRILDANPAFCTFIGQDLQTLQSSTWQELTHPEDLETDLAQINMVKDGKIQNYQIQKRYIRPDGTVIWGLLSVACLRDKNGAVQYFISQIADISEEMKTRTRLADSEEHFRLLAENASDIVVQTNNEGLIQWIAPGVTTALGVTPAQLHGELLRNLVHPEEWDALDALLEQLKNATQGDIEARLRVRDSGYRWFAISMKPLLGTDGRMKGGVGGFRDIHAQVRNRDIIKAERRRLKTTLDSMLDPHVLIQPVWNTEGHISDFLYADANPMACEALGLPRERLLGRSMMELFPALETSGLMNIFRQTVKTGEEAVLDDFEYPTNDGSPAWLDVRVVRVEGQVSMFWRNVTERHRASAQIAASEERYRLLAMNSSDVVVRIAEDDRILWISPSVSGALGWTPEECEGRPVPEFLGDDVALTRYKAGKAILFGGRTAVNRFKMRAKDGSLHWIEFHAGPDRDKDGNIVGLIASFRIVDKEVASERLLEKQARSDVLTGLNNRRSFEVIGRREVARACRHGEPLSVMIMDIDHFKSINDAHGHDAGDEVLRAVAQTCAAQLREIDLFARLGGEEFAMLLPATDIENAMGVAERMRQTLAQTAVTTCDGNAIFLTVSIGVAEVDDKLRDLKALLRVADIALYRAKDAGRNRVCAHAGGTDARASVAL